MTHITPRPAYFVGPWDLHRDLACVPRSPKDGSVVLVESIAKSRALPYHRKKLVLVLSAMRHFAEELRAEGFDVSVVRAATYVEGIAKHVKAEGATAVIAMMPREQGLQRALLAAKENDSFGVPLELHDDGGAGGHFLLTRDEISTWMNDRKVIRMHHFYAWMRKRTGYLMEDGKPTGGKYSFDGENRKPPSDARPEATEDHKPDAITRAAMKEVAAWDGFFGEVDGFDWPVTREGALRELDDFFSTRAERFGPFQDAMITDEPFLWHTRIAAAMNLSLLSPHEVCERVVRAYREGVMPLNSAEGLLRQILGWREFIRGVYWHRMPDMRSANLLKAKRTLPKLYWEPESTDLRCLSQSAGQVRETGYAHHIQRLMVLGNFALLTDVEPIQLSHWFWAAFVDAYEWVQLPNVHGMALFADDTFTTKPYAASGSYIHKMSDYCKGCRYNVKKRTGDDACPFNSLFWRFMGKHRQRLEENPRLRMLYRTWDKFGVEEQQAIRAQAETFLSTLEPSDHGWTFHDDQC
ncbi:MAG: deoxyribodipyrimidine photolyase-related protein [Polyangiales bacterium]|jgi:deoxyribodipyrimidine photolyase-related protein